MDNLYENIGKRIAKLRKLNRITQEELAEKLDVSIKHISEVERGKSSLSLEKIIDVCNIFDCSIDYLVLGRNADSLSLLPPSIIDRLNSGDSHEIALLRDYLSMYDILREG